MRLLTHNFLQSNVKGTENGYPLGIEVDKLEVENPPSPVNRELLLRLLPKLNYGAVRQAAEQMAPHVAAVGGSGGESLLPQLPQELPPLPPPPPPSLQNSGSVDDATTSTKDDESKAACAAASMTADDPWAEDSELVINLYRVLFDWHLIEGNLVCPGTGRKFPVKDSIPNMLLHADEI